MKGIIENMVCPKCGYKNQQRDKTCDNCGAALEAEYTREELDRVIERLADRGDLLTPTRLEVVLKWIFFFSAPIVLIVCILYKINFWQAALFAVIAVFGGIAAGYPKIIWALEEFRISMRADTGEMAPTEFWNWERKIAYGVLGLIVLVRILGLVYGWI